MLRSTVRYGALAGLGVLSGLPLEWGAEMWGGEISLRSRVHLSADETSTYELEVGDVGYCPSTGCIVLYIGTTPLSTEDRPVARYLVSRIGRITDGLEQLERVREGLVLRLAWA